MIQINFYMHFLTLDENNTQQRGMFQEYYLCTCILCTSVILFTDY